MPDDHHHLFDLAIDAFLDASPSDPLPELHEGPGRGYLLLDFHLQRSMETERFTVHPAIPVKLVGPYVAFVAEVEPFDKRSWGGANVFAAVVAAIASFSLGRPVRSPRNDWYFSRPLNDERVVALAAQAPVLNAGPGAHQTIVAPATADSYAEELRAQVSLLNALPVEQQNQMLRACRLVQAAHNTVREDFSLAYFLLVSAIESVATKAIARRSVVQRHPSLAEWKLRGKEDPTFRSLLEAYQEEHGKQQFLRQRFVEFLLQYCPPKTWPNLAHPLAEIEVLIEHVTGQKRNLNPPGVHEVHPGDLEVTMVRDILDKLYVHRSKFAHEGASPPHRRATSFNQYFDREFIADSKGRWTVAILPNYRLLSFLAKSSILGYASSLGSSGADGV